MDIRSRVGIVLRSRRGGGRQEEGGMWCGRAEKWSCAEKCRGGEEEDISAASRASSAAKLISSTRSILPMT